MVYLDESTRGGQLSERSVGLAWGDMEGRKGGC